MIFIYITCKNKKEAKKIGLFLIKKRLAGCCNIFPIESISPVRNVVKDYQRTNGKILTKKDGISNEVYWWEGKIVKSEEI